MEYFIFVEIRMIVQNVRMWCNIYTCKDTVTIETVFKPVLRLHIKAGANGCNFENDLLKFILLRKINLILMQFVPTAPVNKKSALLSMIDLRQATCHYLS